MTARVVVVGLGPAGPDLLTDGTRAAIERIPTRFLLTRQHPSAEVLSGSTSFDEVRESAATVAEIDREIIERLVTAATEQGEVLYAVPGSPAVAEPTVALLETDSRVDTEVVPALSFLDLSWVSLGVDPLSEGVRLVDGHDFATQAAGSSGPFLVAQCDSAAVLSDLQTSVESPPDLEVVVLQRLGLPDESVETVLWEELHEAVRPDHLTSLFVPKLETPVAPEFARLQELVLILRAECPWDREQTHESLRRHLLEETYEVLEAIDRVSAEDSVEAYSHLEEELGDLLYQVYFHAALAAEEGRFGVGDVAVGIHDKLRRRHPHVFGDVDAGDAAEVLSNWEAIKQTEKQRDSVLDGIPPALPALLFASKVQGKSGMAPSSDLPSATRAALDADGAGAERAIGELLQVAVAVSRDRGIDPELALHNAATAFAARYREAEVAAAGEGVDLGSADESVRAHYL